MNPTEVERWLEQILDAWRVASPDQPIEPWNFSYLGAEADRSLGVSLEPGAECRCAAHIGEEGRGFIQEIGQPAAQPVG